MYVNSTDINNWAKRRESQQQLPRLVRRLIHATIDHVLRIHFPSDESVQVGGWDGELEVECGNAFVPDGPSFWELGTQENIKGKADDDYEKRTENSLGADRSQSTFVFVTPRKWSKKSEWEAARRSEGHWRDVRVLDAEQLADWLETPRARAVHIWFSEHLAQRTPSVVDAERAWSDWAQVTWPPITPRLVFAGREELLATIDSWIGGTETALTLQGESPKEATAVFLAALLRRPPEQQDVVLSRVAVVRSPDAWNLLVTQSRDLVLVKDFDGSDIGSAFACGHRVVVPRGRADKDTSALLLPPLTAEAAAEALADLEVKKDQVEPLARIAARSLTVLRRRMSRVLAVVRPPWASQPVERVLTAALLAGRWSAASEGDSEVLATLSGMPKDDVLAAVVRLADANDPPVRCVGSARYLTCEPDAWELLGPHLTDADMARFKAVAVEVLSTPDPAFDLPDKDRWMAGVIGERPKHSALLRAGIARTLAFLGTLDTALRTAEGSPLGNVVDPIVRDVLASDDWKVWASLRLREIAEAAPDEFLRAARRGVNSRAPFLADMFRKEADQTLFDSPPHTELLWAMELLALNAEHLVGACGVLGKLAAIDPGGNWANRPAASLRTILLPWSPQTGASSELRLAAIDALRRQSSDVAWKVMISLLPKAHDHSHPAPRCRWRDWRPVQADQIPFADYLGFVRQCVQRVLDDAGRDGARWSDVISAAPHLPPGDLERVVTALECLADLPDPEAATVCDALRHLIHDHRSFADANWALPAASVDRFAAVLPRLEPNEALYRFSWLFSNNPALPDASKRDYAAYEEQLRIRQVGAIEQIRADFAPDWIPACVAAVDRPDLVGIALAQTELASQEENQALTDSLGADENLRRFIHGFIWHRAHGEGDWATRKLAENRDTWTAVQTAAFCTHLPFEAATWQLLTSLDEAVSQEYWKSVPAFHASPEATETAAARLLEYGRPCAAAGLVCNQIKHSDAHELVLGILDAIARGTEREIDRGRVDPHDISVLLQYLAAREIESVRLARLEWQFFPLIRHHYSPSTLHQELARDPEFFVSVVSLAYRGESDSDEGEVDDQRHDRAVCAYELLDSWRFPLPGHAEATEFSIDSIDKWVDEARKRLAASGRLDIGDSIIGQHLSRTPEDPTGVWPCRALRDLTERIDSDAFDEGLAIGMLNSEGVVCRSDRSGAPEREKAARFEALSQNAAQWPRTAALLRQLQGHYLRRADDRDRELGLAKDLAD